MGVLEEVVAECAEGKREVDEMVKLSMFGSLIFMVWVGMQPRWWLKRFVPWWNSMEVGEMQEWFSGRVKYGTYVLASPLTRRTYVGKFWRGSVDRMKKHVRTTLDTGSRGGKKLYGGLRTRGIHTYFMLPLRTYRSKGDCNADEKVIIKRTQRSEDTLNTVGIQRRRSRAGRP
ncbi:hypothetical protein CYMTET_37738 [Cymbomonas tetramitiformis]|uniref:Uncharacterized protein n=1 Tax=Cymbomonas tetramitiformis TaxID=36881 RepID=A0AAE0CDB9_9CHLO|nr:hypothetical protein CYMTET_37738 [Cymbomonas tetramitiformis]